MDTPDEHEATVEQPFAVGPDNVLATELNAILAERERPIEGTEPLEFLSRLSAEAAIIPGRQLHGGDTAAVPPGEYPIGALERTVLERLRETGYGDFVDLPVAVDALGPRIVRVGTFEDLGLNAADEAVFVSMVVLLTKPDSDESDEGKVFSADRLPKRKTETNQYSTLRTALTYMRDMSGETTMHQLENLREEGQEINVDLQRLRVIAAASPDNAKAQDEYQAAQSDMELYYSDYSLARTAIKYSQLYMLALREGQITFTGSEAASALRNEATKVEAEPMLQEDWVILPPEPSERPAALRAESAGLPVEIRQRREERIDELHKLVRDWGDGEVRFSQLRGTGGDRYYVAILPQTLEDGTLVEHAVVDNPMYRNARMAWRGDLGQTNDKGEPVTWRDVFSHYKSDANEMGAKRIPHQGDWEATTIDYLTKDASEL